MVYRLKWCRPECATLNYTHASITILTSARDSGPSGLGCGWMLGWRCECREGSISSLTCPVRCRQRDRLCGCPQSRTALTGNHAKKQIPTHGALLSVRLKSLKAEGYLEVEKIPHVGNAAKIRQGPRSSRSWVRILPKGEDLAKKIWGRYERLSQRLLGDLPQEVLDHHFKVNKLIHQRIAGDEDYDADAGVDSKL